MRKTWIALGVSLLLLCCAAASAGVNGHFISESGDTNIFILSKPIDRYFQGVYLGNSGLNHYLERKENKDGSLHVFTPIFMNDVNIDLQLKYEDKTKQVALVNGSIKRFDADGALIEDQSVPDMQGVRFIRQEVLHVSQLRGTLWNRCAMFYSGKERNYPFDFLVIEFFDTGDNTGQIPDSVEQTYPFTYKVSKDQLNLQIEADGKITKATVKIENNLLIVKIGNSTLHFLPTEY